MDKAYTFELFQVKPIHKGKKWVGFDSTVNRIEIITDCYLE